MKLFVDTRPAVSKSIEDGDRFFDYIAHLLAGSPAAYAPPTRMKSAPAAAPAAAPVAAVQPVSAWNASPIPDPMPMTLGPNLPPALSLAALASPPKGSSSVVGDPGKATPSPLDAQLQALLQPSAPGELPKFDVSDLLPDKTAIAEAMKAKTVDIRPLAALMDSIYGTKTAQGMTDRNAEMLQEIKAAEGMMGYSPAMQQVLGQARLEEFKAKLDQVTGQDEKQFERLYKLKALEDKAEDRRQAQRQFAMSYGLDKEKLEIEKEKITREKKSISSPGYTDAGKPQTASQEQAQAQLELMNRSSPNIDRLEKNILTDKDRHEEFLSLASDYLIWRDLANAPYIGQAGGQFLASIMIDGLHPKLAPGLYSLFSKDEQEYLAEMTNFLAGKLRKDSGASISEAEFRREYDRYFPRPGASQEVIEQKRRLRHREIYAMRTQTGRLSQFAYGEDDL